MGGVDNSKSYQFTSSQPRLSFTGAMKLGVETNAKARMAEDCKKGIAKFLEK